MVSAGGFALRGVATVFYVIEFCCAAIVLGVYSYFLAVLANHNLPIETNWKAVEGISGVAVLYTIFAAILTCFLAGFAFFAFLGVAFDVLFCAAFIALAILTRDGDSGCSGYVQTPLGDGPSSKGAEGYGANGFGFTGGDTVTYFPNLGLACSLNTAAFAVSIIGAFCFLISAILQVFVARHHQKEKKYGPSPANDYTSGSGRRGMGGFFKRNPFKKQPRQDALPANPTPYDTSYETSSYQPMYDTGAHSTNGTMTSTEKPIGANAGMQPHQATTPYHGAAELSSVSDQPPHIPQGGLMQDHSGYHTAPTGTAVNPYGYSQAAPHTASNF